MLTLPPALNILPPADWQTTETPGTYHCTLPACRRRRFSYGIRERQLWVRFHCTLKRADCTSDECRACPQAEPESGELKQLPVEERGGNQTIIQGRYSAQPDLHVAAQTPEEFRRPWIVDHFHPPQAIPPAKASSSLAAIEATLPPYKEGRDRKVRFEADGTIVYEKEQGHWEPPRDINGYQRDPENSWRFIPLWKPCALRHQVGVRYANCGCINIIMRCGHPKCPKFGDRVSHTDCADCLLRTQEPNDGMPGLPGQS
jgi:hypothetical protein